MGEPENAEAADTLFPVFDKEMAEILESFIVGQGTTQDAGATVE